MGAPVPSVGADRDGPPITLNAMTCHRAGRGGGALHHCIIPFIWSRSLSRLSPARSATVSVKCRTVPKRGWRRGVSAESGVSAATTASTRYGLIRADSPSGVSESIGSADTLAIPSVTMWFS